MNLGLNDSGNQKISVVFILFMVVSLIVIISLAFGVNAMSAKVKQQAAVIAEKDKQLEDAKVKYTSLAARLHKEVKKVGELEEQLGNKRR